MLYFVLIWIALLVLFVYGRLRATNMNVPANAEHYDAQVVTYIQPLEGEKIPRARD